MANYILLTLPDVPDKPLMVPGVLANPAQRTRIWGYYQALAHRQVMKDVIFAWQIVGEYTSVIDELRLAKYVKAGADFVAAAIDRDRVGLTTAQLVAERDALIALGVPLTAVFTTDPLLWLSANGYVAV